MNGLGMGLLGLGGGMLLGGGGGGRISGQGIERMETLTPGQANLLDTLVKQLSGIFAQPEGTVAGPSALQQQAFGLAGQVPGQIGQFQGMGQQALRGLLDQPQFDPTAITKTFEPVRQFATKMFEEDITPQIMGRFAQMGGARSSGAQTALARAGSNLAANLSAQMAPYQFGAREASLGRQFAGQQAAIPGAMGLGQMPLAGASQLYNIGAGQRGIRAQQMAEPWQNPALNFLQMALATPGFGNVGFQGFRQPGIMESIIPAAGMAMGGYLQQPGTGLGSLFGGLKGLFG